MDARRMLILMRSSRGQMKGHLQYRRGGYGPWMSSYCCIECPKGSLLCDARGSPSARRRLIPDLRGCRLGVSFDDNLQVTLLNVTARGSTTTLQLHPVDSSRFYAWFAALLCWESVQPAEQLPPIIKPNQAGRLLSVVEDNHFISNRSPGRDVPVIKVGKLSILTALSHKTAQSTMGLMSAQDAPRINSDTSAFEWQQGSCMLRENGDLIIYDSELSTLARLELSGFPRSAIQLLHPSALGTDLCVAIYPQYTRSESACAQLRPFYLRFDSRVLLEVWFVLFRAFCTPEMYGVIHMHIIDCLKPPEILPGLSEEIAPGKFRLERSLTVRICEAKMHAVPQAIVTELEPTEKASQKFNMHVEIFVDGHIRARTSAKGNGPNPYWFESFDNLGLTSGSSVRVDLISCQHDTSPPSIKTLGSVMVLIDTDRIPVPTSKPKEQWYPVLDDNEVCVGEVLVSIKINEEVMLMDHEYGPLSDMLHHFPNSLTAQIADHLPLELSSLAECLLNIFQVSGQATEWLVALAEEEIDGTVKSSLISRLVVPQSPMPLQERGSASSLNGVDSGERAAVVRDLGRSATAEANLLFRGNTLFSKALDHHMKRLGKDYLEETLGVILRQIQRLNLDYEVDPARLVNTGDLNDRWTKLLTLTEQVWTAIAQSVERCPGELRIIFRHIQACAQDRYGDFLRTVAYSSVSGFLFLRFFCPAILNPRLFGLMQGKHFIPFLTLHNHPTNKHQPTDQPNPHAQRTFTLLAKSLQGLANMSTFGAKEPWMAPMNAFLTSSRQDFRAFIDAICAVPASDPDIANPINPSYSTPLAIFTRLDQAAKEGFPSLPYLIDPGRSFATLINLWLDNQRLGTPTASVSATEIALTNIPNTTTNTHSLPSSLLHFHTLCTNLRHRARSVLDRAERAEYRTAADDNNPMALRWLRTAERMEARPEEFWLDADAVAAQAAAASPAVGRGGVGGAAGGSRPSTGKGSDGEGRPSSAAGSSGSGVEVGGDGERGREKVPVSPAASSPAVERDGWLRLFVRRRGRREADG